MLTDRRKAVTNTIAICCYTTVVSVKKSGETAPAIKVRLIIIEPEVRLCASVNAPLNRRMRTNGRVLAMGVDCQLANHCGSRQLAANQQPAF